LNRFEPTTNKEANIVVMNSEQTCKTCFRLRVCRSNYCGWSKWPCSAAGTQRRSTTKT